MKIIILLLLVGVFWEGCRFRERHEIKFLSEASGLKVPDDITDIEYRYVKNEDYNYPYDFYSRFKCDSEVYLIIRRQMFAGDQTGANDANLYISSRMLARDKQYLHAYDQVDWWDVRNTVKPERLYVNYFGDRGKKRIGDMGGEGNSLGYFYCASDVTHLIG